MLEFLQGSFSAVSKQSKHARSFGPSSHFLQENSQHARRKPFAAIYTMHTSAPFSKLGFVQKTVKFANFLQTLTKYDQISLGFGQNLPDLAGIYPISPEIKIPALTSSNQVS